MSAVFQESLLFNTSVRENILLGKLDATEMGRQFRALARSLGLDCHYHTSSRETPRSRRKKLRRYDVRQSVASLRGWKTKRGELPPADPAQRPSKAAKRTGYRTNSEAHRNVRLKLSPERRAEIARKGAEVRWNSRLVPQKP